MIEFRKAIQLLIFLQVACDNIKGAPNIYFNSSGIHFYPNQWFLIERFQSYYLYNATTTMLKVISTRFQHMILPFYPKESSDFSYHNLPTTTATINQLGPSLKLSLLLPIKTSNIAKSFMDKAVHAANAANKIYPQTVSRILVDIRNADEELLEEIAETVSMQFKQNQNHAISHPKVPFGLYILLTGCASLYNPTASLLNRTKKMVNFIDSIVILYISEAVKFPGGPEQAFEAVEAAFTDCEKEIKQKYPNKSFSIYLNTGWESKRPIEESSHSTSNLTKYWELFSAWAVQKQTLVYFNRAFDFETIEENKHKLVEIGWWKKSNKCVLNLTANCYTEKWSVNPNITEAPVLLPPEIKNAFTEDPVDPESPADNTTTLTVVIPVSIVVGGILLVSLMGAIFWLRRKVQLLKRGLSKEDYDQFMKGGLNDGKNVAWSLPYDINLELSKDIFTIDYSAALGSGAFGRVYKGRIQGFEKEFAFKMANPSSSGVNLRGLLSEIKVLSYLGRHEHIVALIGSYTHELKKGILYVATELCEEGCLEKHLRRSGAAETDYLNSIESTAIEMVQCNSQLDMLRWSLEIASGMQFISSKNVVHADLATRNVLLTRDFKAKIADFGLSRRMYDYTKYVKKNQEPLPWRWMAIESLRNFTFSEKSDVWAFGCTMWEIYTWGDIPYQGLGWSTDFVEKLQKGLRLQCPSNASSELYELMSQCWLESPAKRISFNNLENTLRNLYLKYVQ